MRWLRKLLGRERDHDAWLAKNPGKKPMGSAAPAASEEEQQRMREMMEAEMDEQRTRREEA
ncbi:MAG: hypothetical protein Kow0010_26230 [Dehalococcoidia bacterium]